MKKIITSIVAVMLLFTMVFSMASCFDFGFGSVDMDELADTIEKLDEDDYTWTGTDAEDDVNDYILKQYTVREIETGYTLKVTQFENKDLAKQYLKLQKFEKEMNEKYERSEKEAEEYYDLMLKWYELRAEAGDDAAEEMLKEYEDRDFPETVLIRKGDVVIEGNKEIMKELDI